MNKEIENLIKEHLENKGYFVRQITFEIPEWKEEDKMINIIGRLVIRASKK